MGERSSRFHQPRDTTAKSESFDSGESIYPQPLTAVSPMASGLPSAGSALHSGTLDTCSVGIMASILTSIKTETGDGFVAHTPFDDHILIKPEHLNHITMYQQNHIQDFYQNLDDLICEYKHLIPTDDPSYDYSRHKTTSTGIATDHKIPPSTGFNDAKGQHQSVHKSTTVKPPSSEPHVHSHFKTEPTAQVSHGPDHGGIGIQPANVPDVYKSNNVQRYKKYFEARGPYKRD